MLERINCLVGCWLKEETGEKMCVSQLLKNSSIWFSNNSSRLWNLRYQSALEHNRQQKSHLKMENIAASAWGWRTLTGVVDLHVSERLQRVLEGDAVQVQRSHAVVHLLGVGDELVGELLDLLGAQVPSQPVLRADRHRAGKHHLTWDNKSSRTGEAEDGTKRDGSREDGTWGDRTGNNETGFCENTLLQAKVLPSKVKYQQNVPKVSKLKVLVGGGCLNDIIGIVLLLLYKQLVELIWINLHTVGTLIYNDAS